MNGIETQGDPWKYFDEMQTRMVYQLINERMHPLLRRISRLEGFVNYAQNFLPGGLKLEAQTILQEAKDLALAIDEKGNVSYARYPTKTL